MKILRSVGTVSGLTLASRVLGFLRDKLVATLLGAGATTDGLIIALKIPGVFRRLFAEGALSAAFVPIFSGLETQQGREKAREFAEEIFSLLFIAMLGFVIIFEVFLPFILPWMAPGLAEAPERFPYALQFSRITFPFILFICVCALYSSVLNSFERFAAAASSPMVGNAFILVCVMLFHPYVENTGMLFAWAVLGCSIVQMIWVVVPVERTPFRLRLRWPRLTHNVKKMLSLMGPVALGSGVHQFNVLVGVFMGSFLPAGGISCLYYAERLIQLPTSTIGTALATVMLPLLSRQIRAAGLHESNKTQNQALEFALIFALPTTAVLAVLAYPLIVVLFAGGAFGLEQAARTAQVLVFFACGLPAYILAKLFNTIFYAYEDTRTPLVYAMACVLLDVLLAATLLKFFQHVGIALATAVSSWAYVLALGMKLHRMGRFVIMPSLRAHVVRLVIATAASALIMGFLKSSLWADVALKSTQIGLLLGMLGAGIVVYFGLGYGLGVFTGALLRGTDAKK